MLVEDRRVAALLAPRLSGLGSVAGALLILACPARHLGAAAALLEKYDEARAYYQQGLEVCGKTRFGPEIALTRLQLAELLLEHYPEERTEALQHLDFAIGEFQQMKMQPSLERPLRHRDILKA